MNKFELAEEKGRIKFETFLLKKCIFEYNFTQDPFNNVDVYWMDEDEQINVGEIKNRETYNSYSPIFKKEGILIEYIKYKSLINIYELKGYIPYYINFFRDDRMLIFDLRDLDLKFELKKFPKTTKGKKELIEKEVAYIPYNKAKIIDLKK